MDEPTPLHETGPVVDQAHLHRMTGGDQALAHEVLGLFRQQWDIWARLLEPTTETLDWGHAAHTIKGSARGIGAWKLADICDHAETAARTGELTRQQKREWLDAISLEMNGVLIEIARLEHKALLDGLRT